MRADAASSASTCGMRAEVGELCRFALQVEGEEAAEDVSERWFSRPQLESWGMWAQQAAGG